jgi:hypothetical protein
MEHRISTSLDFDEVRIRDAAAAAVLVLAASVAADGAGLMAEPLRIAGVWLLVAVAYLAASCTNRTGEWDRHRASILREKSHFQSKFGSGAPWC